MVNTPSPNGSNGRAASGRFAKGNPGGPGNPHARRAARLRSALYKAVTPDDLRDVIQALLSAAKGGDVSAAKELMQRLLGMTRIVPDLANATAAWRETSGAFDYVTLNGELLSRHGVYTGGASNGTNHATASILRRRNEIGQVQTALSQIQERVSEVSRRKGALQSEQTELQASLQEAQTELRKQEVAIATREVARTPA